MRTPVAIVLGLLVGWMVEWVIDLFYWRRPKSERDLADQLKDAEREIEDLEAELAEADREPAVIVEERVVVKEVVKVREKEDLQLIHGIGPTYAKRFKAAGVTTYAQLAALTVDIAREIAQLQDWQAADPAAWIAEAKQLARRAEEEVIISEETSVEETTRSGDVQP